MAKKPVAIRHASSRRSNLTLPIITSVVLAVVAFAGTYAVTLRNQLQNEIDRHDISGLVDTSKPGVELPADSTAGKSVNILLLGSDIRDGENAALGGDNEGARADVTMIAHISADRSRVDMLSIPRDSEVRISDCKRLDGSTVKGWTTKFNAAFANGASKGGTVGEAAACVIQTIYDLTGINIDHFAVIDFAGFRDMVNALGGVPMCVEKGFTSPKAAFSVTAGPHVFNGDDALGWVRSRTGTYENGKRMDGSDIERIARQQLLMTNLLSTALSKNLLTDIPELTQFIKAGASSLATDKGLDIDRMLGLALSMRSLNGSDIYFATTPFNYKGANVEWTDEAYEVFEAIILDQPIKSILAPEVETPDGSGEPGGLPSSGPVVTPSPSASTPTQEDILASC